MDLSTATTLCYARRTDSGGLILEQGDFTLADIQAEADDCGAAPMLDLKRAKFDAPLMGWDPYCSLWLVPASRVPAYEGEGPWLIAADVMPPA